MAVTVTPDQARQEIESGYVNEVFVRWIAACGQMGRALRSAGT